MLEVKVAEVSRTLTDQLGVSLGLGISALVVQDRLAQGGYPVPVTRVEALGAPNNALMASLLLGTGVALAAGGITWMALTPTKTTKGTEAWTLSLGGNF